jgi:catechol-2,3-dioxygenase
LSSPKPSEAIMAANINELRALTPPEGMPFKIQRLGHVVLQVSNLERSARFYTMGQDTIVAR